MDFCSTFCKKQTKKPCSIEFVKGKKKEEDVYYGASTTIGVGEYFQTSTKKDTWANRNCGQCFKTPTTLVMPLPSKLGRKNAPEGPELPGLLC